MRATDFNGIKLLDGSLQGEHDGSGLNSTGKLKVHFGSANASAEDYYYVEIGNCTTGGLGLRNSSSALLVDTTIGNQSSIKSNSISESAIRASNTTPTVNDCPDREPGGSVHKTFPLQPINKLFSTDGTWYLAEENFKCIIPKGSKNVLINIMGCGASDPAFPDDYGDNDIELFTLSGQHLVGTPLSDYVFRGKGSLNRNSAELGFGIDDYDNTYLNTGPLIFDGNTLNYSTYNNMNIGYRSGGDINDATPNDGRPDMDDYEILVIDEVTEDLIIWLPGAAGMSFKAYGTFPRANQPSVDNANENELISIKTQEKAQQALERIDNAIVAKDKVRASLGATQNRLENTVTNLTIMAENMLSADEFDWRVMPPFFNGRMYGRLSCALLTIFRLCPGFQPVHSPSRSWLCRGRGRLAGNHIWRSHPKDRASFR